VAVGDLNGPEAGSGGCGRGRGHTVCTHHHVEPVRGAGRTL